jgi:3-hydroxyacyl-CoA dehydrogenase / enoyl-CoA hydratase / 3-hydroxybutyryl-CoA epimerase
VVVQECPGFLVNRLLMPYLGEATYCLQEGAASRDEIDGALVDFGMPMGPFTLMDMTGIDVCTHAGEYMFQEYGPRSTLPQLYYKMVEAGRLGEKVGKGFYSYGDEVGDPTLDILARLPKDPNSKFSVERLIYPMINEAALCLQEHIASPSDIDMACVAGLGMTYHGDRKGPLAIADEIGLDVVLQGLEELRQQYGERFHPAQLLKTKVRAGHLGVKAHRGFMEYA